MTSWEPGRYGRGGPVDSQAMQGSRTRVRHENAWDESNSRHAIIRPTPIAPASARDPRGPDARIGYPWPHSRRGDDRDRAWDTHPTPSGTRPRSRTLAEDEGCGHGEA